MSSGFRQWMRQPAEKAQSPSTVRAPDETRSKGKGKRDESDVELAGSLGKLSLSKEKPAVAPSTSADDLDAQLGRLKLDGPLQKPSFAPRSSNTRSPASTERKANPPPLLSNKSAVTKVKEEPQDDDGAALKHEGTARRRRPRGGKKHKKKGASPTSGGAAAAVKQEEEEEKPTARAMASSSSGTASTPVRASPRLKERLASPAAAAAATASPSYDLSDSSAEEEVDDSDDEYTPTLEMMTVGSASRSKKNSPSPSPRAGVVVAEAHDRRLRERLESPVALSPQAIQGAPPSPSPSLPSPTSTRRHHHFASPPPPPDAAAAPSPFTSRRSPAQPPLPSARAFFARPVSSPVPPPPAPSSGAFAPSPSAARRASRPQPAQSSSSAPSLFTTPGSGSRRTARRSAGVPGGAGYAASAPHPHDLGDVQGIRSTAASSPHQPRIVGAVHLRRASPGPPLPFPEERGAELRGPGGAVGARSVRVLDDRYDDLLEDSRERRAAAPGRSTTHLRTISTVPTFGSLNATEDLGAGYEESSEEEGVPANRLAMMERVDRWDSGTEEEAEDDEWQWENEWSARGPAMLDGPPSTEERSRQQRPASPPMAYAFSAFMMEEVPAPALPAPAPPAQHQDDHYFQVNTLQYHFEEPSASTSPPFGYSPDLLVASPSAEASSSTSTSALESRSPSYSLPYDPNMAFRGAALPRSDSVSSSAANTSNLSMFSDEQLEQEILKRELAKLNAEPPPGPAPNDTINPAQLQLPSPPTMYDPNPFPYTAAGDIAVPTLADYDTTDYSHPLPFPVAGPSRPLHPSRTSARPSPISRPAPPNAPTTSTTASPSTPASTAHSLGLNFDACFLFIPSMANPAKGTYACRECHGKPLQKGRTRVMGEYKGNRGSPSSIANRAWGHWLKYHT